MTEPTPLAGDDGPPAETPRRVLIAEDDPISRRLLASTLERWSYEVVVTADGTEAWEALQGPDAPALAILDWMMPGLDGVEICRRLRARQGEPVPYLILLTAKRRREDTVEGLESGADDYIAKPFDRSELRARLRVGVRILSMQQSLADRLRALQAAHSRVKQLQGLLPICSYCKKIRDDQNYWQQVEGYISRHSDAQFSHSICPDCYARVVGPELEEMRRNHAMGRS